MLDGMFDAFVSLLKILLGTVLKELCFRSRHSKPVQYFFCMLDKNYVVSYHEFYALHTLIQQIKFIHQFKMAEKTFAVLVLVFNKLSFDLFLQGFQGFPGHIWCVLSVAAIIHGLVLWTSTSAFFIRCKCLWLKFGRANFREQ